MAYHIGGCEVPESNAFDAFEDMKGMDQTGAGRVVVSLRWQIDLRDVAGDDRA